MSADTKRSTAKAATSLYRCAECGHGKRLTAWGTASVCGPLGADGQIESYDWDEVWEVHEDSIQCSVHPGAVWEKSAGGQWCRWYSCPRCDGDGNRGRCPEEGIYPADGDGKRRTHSGWWPIDDPWPASTLDRLGHVFTPGRDPTCRYCRRFAQSTASAEGQCEGDQHQCPAIVPAGASETGRRIYGKDYWVCFQPGKMNEDFTGWRCDAGHVITAGMPKAHGELMRYPQDYLVAATSERRSA